MDSENASLRNRLRQSAKRGQKSCGPCRARKVKCNRDAPCVRCIRSGYPDLCLYDDRARPSVAPEPSRQQPNVSGVNVQECSSDRTTQAVGASYHSFSTTESPERGHGIGHIDRHPYLGANSLPQFLDSDGDTNTSLEDASRQRARDAMMPMLGIAPSIPGYPFYAPAGDVEEHAIARLFRSLPPSRDMIRYVLHSNRCQKHQQVCEACLVWCRSQELRGHRLFRIYQMDIHPFVPTLVSARSFETELCDYVQNRRHASSADSSSQHLQAQDLLLGMSMAWISTLFALLACGAQFCNEAISARQEQSGLYGK